MTSFQWLRCSTNCYFLYRKLPSNIDISYRLITQRYEIDNNDVNDNNNSNERLMMIDVSWNQNQVTTIAKQKKGKYFKSQWELCVKLRCPKRRKTRINKSWLVTRVTKSWLVLALHLIGWESGSSFLDESQSKVEQNQSNPDYFRHSI